jgi:elongation factor G
MSSTLLLQLDRTGGDPFRVLDQLRSKLGHNAALLHLPIGKDSGTRGIVDIVRDRAIYFDGDFGQDVRYDEVPAELRQQRGDYHHELVEYLANADEAMGEIFLDERKPTEEEVHASIRRSTIKRAFTPVMMGTALKNKGVQPLLDGLIDYMPNPSEVDNFAIDAKKSTEDEEGNVVSYKVKMDPQRTGKKPFVGLAFKLEQGTV